MIEVTGKPDWVIMWTPRWQLEHSRERRERWEQNWARHLNEALRCEVCDTQYYSKQNQEHSMPICIVSICIQWRNILLCFVWPTTRLADRVPIYWSQFQSEQSYFLDREGWWPESPDTNSQCISIFQMKTHWRSVSWDWPLYTEIMNVFMLKLTHFKSLTFELFHCAPRFIEYTCRIIIANVFHC